MDVKYLVSLNGQLKTAHRKIEVQEDLVEGEVLPDAVARSGRKRNVRECVASFDLRGIEMARIERLGLKLADLMRATQEDRT